MNRLLSSITAVAMLGAAATAQVGTGYLFTQSSGTYTPIAAGTLLGTATSGNTMDDNTYLVTLPFPFTFDNVSFTQVQVQTNGHLSFGAVAPGTTYTPLSSTAAVGGFVSACGRDLQGGFVFAGTRTLASNQITAVSSTGPMQLGDVLVGTGIAAGTTITGIAGNVITMSANATATSAGTAVTAYGPWSELRYETQGVSPNQVFIVQWQNFKRYSTALATTQDTYLNFQIRLYQASNAIEAVYGDCAPGATNTTVLHQVGLRGPNNTFPANINARMNVKGTSDWATSVPATANSSGELFNSTAPANVIPNGLTYNWTPALIASNVPYGAGCGAQPASFYEYTIPSTAFDLSNTAITMIKTGTAPNETYVVMPGITAFVPPSGTAVNLGLSDDSTATITPTAAFPYPGGSAASLVVCSNGFVSTASNGTSYQPLPATFLGWANTVWAVWRDFVPTAAGADNIWWEEVGGVVYVTWLNVVGYVGTTVGVTPSTYQFQFDTATGNVHIVFQSMDTISLSTWAGGDGYLVGYSPAGANLDPGSTDLSVALPGTIALQPVDVPALALSAAPTPVLGNTVIYTTSNIPMTALISAQIMSLGQVNPGLPIPGAPGCSQLVDLTISATMLLFGAPSATFSFTIPNDASLIGLPLSNQSASLVPGINPLQAITSNGVKSTISNI
jgi:hypothetical protein